MFLKSDSCSEAIVNSSCCEKPGAQFHFDKNNFHEHPKHEVYTKNTSGQHRIKVIGTIEQSK